MSLGPATLKKDHTGLKSAVFTETLPATPPWSACGASDRQMQVAGSGAVGHGKQLRSSFSSAFWLNCSPASTSAGHPCHVRLILSCSTHNPCSKYTLITALQTTLWFLLQLFYTGPLLLLPRRAPQPQK